MTAAILSDPPGDADLPHHKSGMIKPTPIVRLLLAGIAMAGLIVALTAYETYSRHDRAYQDTQRDLSLLAIALAEYTERTFQATDVLLHNIDADLAQIKLDTPQGIEEATRMLLQRVSDFPGINSINILDVNGELLASSYPIPQPRPTYGDREYFIEARNNLTSKRAQVGRPIFGRKSERWAIPVTLSRVDHKGHFQGAIYAGLDVSTLTDYYGAITPFEGGAAALYRQDARLLARHPLVTEAFSRDYAEIDLFRQHLPASSNGFYRAISSIDGVPRSVAYRSLAQYGLVINVSANENLLEAAWRQSLWLPAITASTGLLVVLAFLIAIVRQWRNQHTFHSRLAWQASHDAVTGLPNRYLFEDRLHKALQSAERKQHVLALLFIDLDNFKRINDSLGHAVGDEVLRTTAAWLRTCVRESDTVARFGGDEFAILLPEAQSASDAGTIAAKILHQFNEPMRIGDNTAKVTTSIGISIFPQDGYDAEQLMASADAAMYRAKENGRNLACHFDQDLADHIRERMQIEECLQDALANGEFTLAFQPIISAQNNHVSSVEALLRWHNPKLGQVAPDRFIAIAESSGLIEAIGEWVIREACLTAAEWPEVDGKPLRIAINLSPRQLAQPDFVDTVLQILAETTFSAARIEFEITENLMITPESQASRNLVRLREAGLGLAIDDFGTGYSSLSYLSRLPVSTLKIDRSFVARLGRSPGDQALAGAIVALARSLGLYTVGEGVETEAQLQTLQQLGCDALQGYLFARPLPAAELAKWLQNRH